MSSLKQIDKNKLERLFRMGSGYVLNFSNNTFQSFIFESVKIDIYQSKYSHHGGSKAKRLRALWDLESDYVVGKLIKDLLEYLEEEIKWNGELQLSTEDKQLLQVSKSIYKKLLGEKNESDNFVTKEDLLSQKFEIPDIGKLGLEPLVEPIILARLNEIKEIGNTAPLSCIFTIGSVLEAIFLGVALQNTSFFKATNLAPKKHGIVKEVHEWRLYDFINVFDELGLVSKNVSKFSHEVRDFRNYIHPYHQMSANFHPNKDSSKLSQTVLLIAIKDLIKNLSKIK